MIEITSWNETAEVLCHLKERVHNIKACATYSKINWQMICKTQSRWCTTCCYTATIERHSILESTMWYEPSDVLCHLKEVIYNIMACATYSQINQQEIFPENLQHMILMMYLESYWLFYSSRQNTFSDWGYLVVRMYIIWRLLYTSVWFPVLWWPKFLSYCKETPGTSWVEMCPFRWF